MTYCLLPRDTYYSWRGKTFNSIFPARSLVGFTHIGRAFRTRSGFLLTLAREDRDQTVGFDAGSF